MLNRSALIKIFDANPLPSLLLLPDGPNFTIIEANAAYLKINDSKKDDLIGKSIFEAFDHTGHSYTQVIAEMRTSLLKVAHSVKAHKIALSGHVLKGQNDPREHYWETENVPVLSDSGKIEYILHTLTNITAQKKYEYLFENNPSSMLVWDFETLHIVDSNAEAELKYGYTKAEFLKLSTRQIRPDEDVNLINEATKDEQAYGLVHKRLWRHKKKNGEIMFMEVNARLIDYNGRRVSINQNIDVTEKVKAEKELKDSQDRYRLLFYYSPLPMWTYDLNTYQILDVNETAIAHYGYSREEFLNMTIHGYRPEEDILKVSDNLKKIKDKEGVHHFGIFTHIKKDGTRIKADISGFQLTYQHKDCMLVVCNDVTERETALEKLKDNELKLLTAQKIARLGYWDLNVDQQSLYWSDEVYNIWGVSKNSFKVSFDSFFETIHPNDMLNFSKAQELAFAGNGILDYEYRIILPNGSVKWVHESGRLVRDVNGNPVVFQGTVQDITWRKEEERHLKLLESVITHTSDAVLITEAEPFDEPGPKILYVNEAFTRMTGYTADEVIGKTPRILQGPNSNKEELKRLSDAIRNWQPYEITIINYKKNGEEFWMDFSVSPVADETGWFTHWIAIERDVTEKIKTEQKVNSERNLIRTLIDNLPHTVNFKNKFARKLISNKIDYEFLGAKSENEVLGKTDLEVLPHGVASIGYDQDMEVLNTGKPLINYEQSFMLDNQLLWLSTTKLPLYNEKNEIIGLLGIGRDITERKIAQEKLKALNKELEKRILELKQSEKKYSDLFHLNPLPMWVFDFNTLQFQDVNIAAIKHYGYSRDEFLNMSIKNIIPADDLEGFEKDIKRLQNEERAFSNESYRHQKKNNEIIQVEVRGNIIGFKDKKSQIVVANDITDRSDYINKIEEQNKLFREISWMQSHVIRAPLARTMGLIDLLKNHDMSAADKDEALKYLIKSANELDSLIKGISDKINDA